MKADLSNLKQTTGNGNGSPRKLRAVGYSRTSGEGQRDNTSIPRQQQTIEEFISGNGWHFVTHYVDECKSGATEDGRDDFKRMIRNAALDEFDVIVPFDVSRFARDGVDILGNAKFLRQNFGVHVVDTKGHFDSRSSGNTLLNFVHAGVSEYERIKIMERMIGGRIARAEAGLPWSKNRPFGRDFDPTTGKWSVNERGHRMRMLLERYVAGERMADLLRDEFTEFSSARVVSTFIRESQLSGLYVKEFNIPEIGIEGLKVSIPAIPEVISPALASRVSARSEHRRKWNKENRRKYVLTGFVRCGHCGTALTGNSTGGRLYYRHCNSNAADGCVFHSTREEHLVNPVLDYLFNFFTDEQSFNTAVARALPDASEQDNLKRECKSAAVNLSQAEREITLLVDAIAKGVDPAMLISKQQELKARRAQEATRLAGLTKRLNEVPSQEVLQQEAQGIRLQLLRKVKERDWRKLSFDEIRQFLIFLFGENPGKSSGIRLTLDRGHWRITFQGNVTFHHEVVDGRPVSHLVRDAAQHHNKQVQRKLKEFVNLTRQT